MRIDQVAGEEVCERSVNLIGSEVRLGPTVTQPKSVEPPYANLPDIRLSSGTPGEEVHPKSGMTQRANCSESSEANANYCISDLFSLSSPNVDSAYYTARVERKETPLTSCCPEDQQPHSEEKTERRSEANENWARPNIRLALKVSPRSP